MEEVFSNEQVIHRKMIWEQKKGDKMIKTVGNPLHFGSGGWNMQDVDQHSPPPMLGEHTNEILKKMLAMEDEKIEQLRKEGIIQ